MANSIAKLAVHIIANASGVKAGVTQAQGYLSGFGKSVGTLFSGGALGTIGNVFAPITNLLSGAVTSHMGSLADKFKELASSVTETSRNAQRLGLPVEDLMGLQYAAERSGIEVEVLNKALFHLARHEGGDVMQNLLQAADRFNVDDGINKAAFAFDKFAKSGFAMSNLLARGSGGIRELMQQGRDLGLVLSAVDVSNLQQANATLKTIGMAVDGLYNKVLVAMAPAITNVGEMLMQMAPTLGSIADAMGAAFGDTLEVGVMLLRIIIEQGKDLAVTFMAWLTNWNDGFSGAAGSMDAFRDGLKFLAKAFAYVWDTAVAGIGVFQVHLGAVQATLGQIGEALDLSWGKKLTALGVANIAVGAKMVGNWGKTADAIDAKWGGMFKKMEAKSKAAGLGMEAAYHATGAAIEGSKEDMSIRARFSFESAMAQDPKLLLQKQQLEQEKATAQAAKEIVDRIRRAPAWGVF